MHAAREARDDLPTRRLDDPGGFERANRPTDGLNAAPGGLGDLLMAREAFAGFCVQEREQQDAQYLDAEAADTAAMLAGLSGPAVEREGEIEEPDPHIAVDRATLRRPEPTVAMIGARARWPTADGAGDGID